MNQRCIQDAITPMPNVWYAVPSARTDGGTVRQWKDAGYRVAVYRDPGAELLLWADLTLTGPYPGYANAVNAMCREILTRWPDTQWIVTGGDDIDPDSRNPEEIAAECTAHFGGTFGVMQPTGDRWGHELRTGKMHVYIENVAGSPWMGAEFCRRMYGGTGPLCSEYHHMFVDEELQRVAQQLGAFWQRPELIQEHHHWMRENQCEPEFLKRANRAFVESGLLFRARAAAGFPGHEPLEAA